MVTLDTFVSYAPGTYVGAVAAYNKLRGEEHRNNLAQLNSAAYTNGHQRSEFYLWFYEAAARAGHEVRWPVAAGYVSKAFGHLMGMWTTFEGIAVLLGSASNEVQAFARTGNQVILDDVFPKLKSLLLDPRPRVAGPAAVEWDAKTLIEEQWLVQKLYDTASGDTVKQLAAAAAQGLLIRAGSLRWGPNADYITPGFARRPGQMPQFAGSVTSVNDRWVYGMKLGAEASTIVPQENGQPVPAPSVPPKPATEYVDGIALARVNVRPRLHLFEAITDTDMNSDELELIVKVMASFTPTEQKRFLAEPRLTEQFAQADGTPQVFRDGISHFGVDLEKQLKAIGGYPGMNWQQHVFYQHVKPMVLRAPAEQRALIRGAEWKKIFVDICDNNTMVEAVADLGLPPAEAAEWIAAET